MTELWRAGMTQSAEWTEPAGGRIADIAQALGVPVSAFNNLQAPTPLHELRDLLMAYSSITDLQGRQRVMDVVRREASRCQDAPDGSSPLG